jgi:hypothetical protein
MLSKQSIEILLDLVEIKISAMQIHDREDARELIRLRSCREELSNERTRRGRKPGSSQKKDALVVKSIRSRPLLKKVEL